MHAAPAITPHHAPPPPPPPPHLSPAVPLGTAPRLVDSDGVVDALEKKTVQMEDMHKRREEDWHRLAKNWIQYEKDLHDHTKK